MKKYTKNNITILCADNMRLMKDYKDNEFDLAIVDPPYGNNDAIGIQNSKSHCADRKNYKQFENKAPNVEYFKELFRVSKHQIVWGGNWFGLIGGYIFWNKNGTAFGEGEAAFCSKINSIRYFEYTWNGMIQENMKEKEHRIHPTQKPVALYKWLLLNYAKKGDKILDTHGGSFSSAIACWQLGFEYVGIEIDEEYYENGVKRLKEFNQPVLPGVFSI